MKFLLFAGEDYYPGGGARDFQGAFDSFEEAVAAHALLKFEYCGGWANIMRTSDYKVVWHWWRGREVNDEGKFI